MRITTWLAALVAVGMLACAPTPAPAQKISDMPAATTPTGAEKMPAIQGAGCATHTTPCANVAISAAQIAALATTVSGNAGTATTLQTARTIAITGDLAYTSGAFNGSGNVTAAGTLATVNANVGTFGSASTIPIVTVNGKGLVTAVSTTPASNVIAKSAVPVSVTGTTAETTLATITIPANAIGPNGQVEIISLWSVTNNANAKTPRVKFGTMVLQAQAQTAILAFQSYSRVANRNSASSQVAFPADKAGGFLTSGTAVTTGAIDTTASVAITLTGQLAVGTDTLTLESYLVRVIYGA